MRKTLAILIALLTFQMGFANFPITLSGTIENHKKSELTLHGLNFEKKLSTNAEAKFKETLDIPYAGTYQLVIGKNAIKLYLDKNSKLNLVSNADFTKEAVFTGEGNLENKYLVAKEKNPNSIKDMQQLFSKSEADFNTQIKSDVSYVENLLKNAKITNKKFLDLEKKHLLAYQQYMYTNYEPAHQYFTKNESFKVSNSFDSHIALTDFDDADLFVYSNFYQKIAADNYSAKDGQLETADGINAYFSKIKGLKNTYLTQNIVKNSSYELRAGNPNNKILLDQLSSMTTDAALKADLNKKYETFEKLKAGTKAPNFNFENLKGGTTTLESMKGKFVYIDIWATWCGPCLQEVPSMKALEEKMHGKNIEFVSISIDELKSKDKWKNMIEKKEMKGVQLFADNAWQSQFVADWGVDSIPRFLLIDPQGNIVNADAPRPSDPALETLLVSLGVK